MRGRHRRARALAGFAALGVYWGAWGAALPAVQRHSRVGDAELGLALLLVALGALVSMRAMGVLIDRFGPRVTRVSVGAFGVVGSLPGLAESPLQLQVSLLFLGATSGAMDVAINADGVREEEVSGRPLLNLAHASFSGAVVCGSLAVGALRAAGAGPAAVLGLAAVAVVLIAVAMGPGERDPHPAAGDAPRPRLFERVPGWVLVLGGLLALAYWIENAWESWSAVHLERSLEAPPGLSALGPAAFAAAMTAGRLTAHRLLRRWRERRLLVGGALVAALGSGVAATAPSAGLALAGIVVAGAGCSVCAPTIVSLTGQAAAARERATLIGSVTTLGYLGFLVGPAAVGGLAEAATLRISLGSVAGLALLLALLFAVVRLPAAGRELQGLSSGRGREEGSRGDDSRG